MAGRSSALNPRRAHPNDFQQAAQPSSSASHGNATGLLIDDADDHDDDDIAAPRNDDADIFANDPLDDNSHHAEPLSFKRKQKQPSQPSLSQPARLLSSLTGNRLGSPVAVSPGSRSGGSTPTRLGPIRPDAPDSARPRDPFDHSSTAASTSKDALPPDWIGEGPGRRVGYDNLTAIDWIFEYTKERQRLRHLYSSTTGFLGYVHQQLDASQVWVVLVCTGLLVGVIAAGIDVASDWLGDLKQGFCSSAMDGGRFYLNRGFCCLGYDQGDKCLAWRPWAAALGITSTGGKWFIEYFFFVVLSVSFAFCAGVLVKEYSIHAKQSGIPEIKTVLGGFIIRRFLDAWTLVTKSLGLCLSVASGMWLGKEGPLVHVACCCANIFIKFFPNINMNEARKREVFSAAAAAGISVAFGSPIGGVLFSLEQLSYYFPDKTMWQSFVCAMTAAVALQAVDPFRSGKLVMYQVQYKNSWHGFEIVPFIFLGILGGIYGGLFIKANMWVARWKKDNEGWIPRPLTQVVLVALLTAIISYPNFYMRAQLHELVPSLFSDCALVLDDPFGLCRKGAATAGTIVLLIFAAILGFLLASITFGLHLPAGIILPSMTVGALTGRAVGIVMEIWRHNHPDFILFSTCDVRDAACITPGVYAIIGAAATLAGVSRMTVSIVVIMFELTGALTYVLPIMIAVMLAKWVGDALSRHGIYEAWIHFNEYPFLDSDDDGGGRRRQGGRASVLGSGSREARSFAPGDMPAGRIMTRVEDLVVLTATGHTIASLRDVLQSCDFRGFPVVSDPRDAVLLGYISRAELAYVLTAASAPPRSLPPETEAFFSSHRFQQTHPHHQFSSSSDLRAGSASGNSSRGAAGGFSESEALDLRPWMDRTPLTLPSRAALQMAVSYFQKLGVRYVLFCDRGVLQGLLTKKDCWHVLNGGVENTTGGGDDGGVGAGAGGAYDYDDGGAGGSAGLHRVPGQEEGIAERGLLSVHPEEDEEDEPGAGGQGPLL